MGYDSTPTIEQMDSLQEENNKLLDRLKKYEAIVNGPDGPTTFTIEDLDTALEHNAELAKKLERLETQKSSRSVREVERLQEQNNVLRAELDTHLRIKDRESELSELRTRLDEYEGRAEFEADLQAIDERVGKATFGAFEVLCKLKSYSERAHVLTALAILLGLDPDNLDQKLE